MLDYALAIIGGCLASSVLVWCVEWICLLCEQRPLSRRRRPKAPRTDFERWLARWDRQRCGQTRTTRPPEV